MLPLLLIGIVTTICSANNPPERSNNYGHGRYAVAVDIPRQNFTNSPEVFRCLRKAGYSTVFFPMGKGKYGSLCSGNKDPENPEELQDAFPKMYLCYTLDCKGHQHKITLICTIINASKVYNAQIIHAPEWDPNAVSNIRQAMRAGLAVEVYMIPRYNLILKGSVQMAEVINYFNSANLGVRRIWVQMKSPEEWDQYQENNRDFLKDMISTAQELGIDVGFYTNDKNWNKITNRWRLEGHHLWYKNVREAGPSGETPANFNDFKPFGKWKIPTVKQFGRKERICGAVVNQDVYDVRSMKSYGTFDLAPEGIPIQRS